jgi:hypothetical protein
LFVADAAFTPVPLAHVAGAGAGLALAVVRCQKTGEVSRDGQIGQITAR